MARHKLLLLAKPLTNLLMASQRLYFYIPPPLGDGSWTLLFNFSSTIKKVLLAAYNSQTFLNACIKTVMRKVLNTAILWNNTNLHAQ